MSLMNMVGVDGIQDWLTEPAALDWELNWLATQFNILQEKHVY